MKLKNVLASIDALRSVLITTKDDVVISRNQCYCSVHKYLEENVIRTWMYGNQIVIVLNLQMEVCKWLNTK